MPQAHGEAIFGQAGSDRVQTVPTLSCCHCGRHWLLQPGSGRQRGFCLRCNAVTCGPHCPAGEKCVPQELLLENLAAGRPRDHYPTQVHVPKLWTPSGD